MEECVAMVRGGHAGDDLAFLSVNSQETVADLREDSRACSPTHRYQLLARRSEELGFAQETYILAFLIVLQDSLILDQSLANFDN